MYTFSADFVTPDSGSSARVAMVTIAGGLLGGHEVDLSEGVVVVLVVDYRLDLGLRLLGDAQVLLPGVDGVG